METAPSRLAVSTSVFEGPLELLLALVEREEVDIFKVSLAKVTDAYLVLLARKHRGSVATMDHALAAVHPGTTLVA